MDIKNQKQDEYLKTRVKNMLHTVGTKNYPQFLSFLDERQRMMIQTLLKGLGCDNFCFYGGYTNATRVMLGIYPDYLSEDLLVFPIKIIQVSFHKNYNLSHRDFLGALMALQIKREVLGDIIIEGNQGYIFVDEDICAYLLHTVEKIGSVGVKLTLVETMETSPEPMFEEICGTVISLRADCIVAMLTKLSRTKSSELIAALKVCINYSEVSSNSVVIKPKDVISIRGYGKFIFCDVVGTSKKGRYFVKINKFV